MSKQIQFVIRCVALCIFATAGLPILHAAINILFVTTNNGSLTALESGRKTMLESYGFTINTIWDGASQATFDAAFANNRAVYLSDEATAADIGYKLRETTIGILSEHPGLADELGFCSAATTTGSSNTINITNNTHIITNVFATGNLSLGSGTYTMIRMGGTTAPGATVLATLTGTNSAVVVDTGGTLATSYNSSTVAFGRRAQFPLPVSVNDGSSFNTNVYTLAQRMLNWAASLDRTLVGHWKLNETTGTSAADSSGLSTAGAVTGTATWTSGVLNNGFQFDGSTKVQVTGMFSNPKNVSVAAWAKLTTADSGGSEIISLGDHFLLRLDEGGVVKAAIYNGSAYQTVTYSGNYAGTGWHHFVAVFDDDNNTFKLYIDGVQATSVSNTSSISYAGLGANTVIGRHGNAGTANDFTGTIDDVRVYNYAITASEVARLFGLIGHWKLNQASGTTANDSTVFARNGTLTGTANWSSDCSGTGNFDFQWSQYFAVANTTDFQPTGMLSIAAWVKGDTWGTGSSANTILRKGDTNPNNFGLQISDGRVELLLDGNDGAGIRGNTVLSAGQWYHVAATWDGTMAKVYVNGVLDNSPGTAKAAPILTDTRPVHLGGRAGGDYFDGMVRDIRLYNRPLTASELVQLAGLVGYWRFAEGSGTTAADTSGLGNTATLSASATWTSDCAGNNNALLTNGTATGIAQTTASFTPPDVGTVAFWMRSTGAPSGVARIMGVTPDWEIRQQVDGTVVTDLCGDGATTICTVTPLTEVGRWYHLAFTFDSSNDTYAIYVDGQLERSGTNPVNMVQQPADRLMFGTRPGATEYWSGALRDVRIYSRQLCPTEIAALNGLIGYWKLEETSGTTAADSSGVGNHGTHTGSPTLGVPGLSNLSASFPSDGKYMIVPASGTLNTLGVSNADFSVAFWVKPGTTPGDWRPLLHKGGANFDRSPGIWLNQANNRVHFRNSTTSNNNEGTDSVSNLPTNVWSHIACVKAGNKWRCYINGALDTEFTLIGNTTGNNGPLYLGDDPWYNGSNVSMDDVRIYSRALCPTEVQQIKNFGNPFGGVKVTKWFEVQ